MARQPTIEVVHRRQAHRTEHLHGSRARLLVQRLDGLANCQRHVLHRADGRRGSALHPVHLRHHRATQGHCAHPRRVHGLHLYHAEIRLRYQGRRSLLVRRRPRLDHRAQLHRLCAFAQRGDQLHVRGGAQPPLPQPLVAPGGELRHHHPVYRPDRYPWSDALRRRLAQPPRPEQPAPAGQRGRTDQPGSLALVLHRHRQGTLPDHGYLVANGDWRLHDLTAADHTPQAGFCHTPALRNRRRRGGRGGQARCLPAKKATW